jgi:serine protease Do
MTPTSELHAQTSSISSVAEAMPPHAERIGRMTHAPSLLALVGALCCCSAALAQAPAKVAAGGSGGAAPASPSASETLAADPDVAAALRISSAFKKVAAQVTPAVVNITASKGGEVIPGRPRGQQMDPQEEFFRRFFGGDPFGQQDGPRRTPQSTSFGSGVIVTADGYVLTNNHVIEGGREIKVTLTDGTDRVAKLIGTDPNTDIAVLKIDSNGTATGYPHATLGDSDAISVGEWVLAVGNPFQFSSSVTSGIVSAKGRQIDTGARRMMYEDFIQTDAAVNPGNSGGPLVNLKGEVIGINTAIYTRSGGFMGISFAVPSNVAGGIMDQLLANGKVASGWLGVEMQALDEKTAESLGVTDRKGVLVSGVTEESPAQVAGLKVEDVVVEINGRPTPNPNSLRSLVGVIGPGKAVPVKVIRAGKVETLTVTLGDRAAAAAKTGEVLPESNKLGLGLATLTPEQAREKFNDRRLRGMLVTDVAEGSPAAQIGLQPDDLLVQLSGRQVTDLKSFTDAMEEAQKRGSARLVIRRGNSNLIATVSLR